MNQESKKYESLDGYVFWRISDCVRFKSPARCAKNYEHLNAILNSGLMEITPYKPEYTRNMVASEEFINEHVWLIATDLGRLYYELRTLQRERQGDINAAYKRGKYDAIKTICDNMYELANIDPSIFEE